MTTSDGIIGVALLGSTGSIGRQALDCLTGMSDRFRIVALAAGRDRETFAAQLTVVRPLAAWLADASGLDVPDGTRLEHGQDGLEILATRDDVDIVVVGTAGIVSLRPVLAALGAGKVVATANKETLVAGGHLVMPLARELAARSADGVPERSRVDGSSPMAPPVAASTAHAMGTALAWLRPIDSEHSAIWQCLVGESPADVERLILTASGGPFLDWTPERLRWATPQDALRHPTWSMGAKITIDSATMMNKGLEVVEAHWLYDVPYERIIVTIHPQSIVHSLVEFVDGSLKAQLGLPDMRIPIQYALTYPHRRPSPAPRLDLWAEPGLVFRPPDETSFPALRVARDAALAGPRATATLIAADEVAVARFLEGSLGFLGIPALTELAVERFGNGPAPDLAELIDLDREVRSWCADAAMAAGT